MQSELDDLVADSKHASLDAALADGAPGTATFLAYPLAVVDVASGALDSLQLVSSGFKLHTVTYNPAKYAWEITAQYNPNGARAAMHPALGLPPLDPDRSHARR